MKSKLLIALLIICTIFSNAFAATLKSATTPLNGTYAYVGTEQCTADVNSSIPATYASSYTHAKAGQRTFTPDTVAYSASTNQQALTAWLTSKSLVSPNSVMNVTQDPTALAGVNLAETPIQWGVTTNQQLGETITNPYATLTPLVAGANSEYFILTSFNYLVPAKNNNIKTGYAIYLIQAGDLAWERTSAFLNINSTTKLVTSLSHIQTSTNQVSYTNNSVTKDYTFDCVDYGILTQ